MEKSQTNQNFPENITLSYADFVKIKNGIKNSINDISDGEEKDYIINNLKNILTVIDEIENKKEENALRDNN